MAAGDILPVVSGIFSATGTSVSMQGRLIAISLTFAGTATVTVQRFMSGDWRTIESFTGSVETEYEGAAVPVRLNCTAHTDNVTYEMRGHPG